MSSERSSQLQEAVRRSCEDAASADPPRDTFDDTFLYSQSNGVGLLIQAVSTLPNNQLVAAIGASIYHVQKQPPLQGSCCMRLAHCARWVVSSACPVLLHQDSLPSNMMLQRSRAAQPSRACMLGQGNMTSCKVALTNLPRQHSSIPCPDACGETTLTRA